MIKINFLFSGSNPQNYSDKIKAINDGFFFDNKKIFSTFAIW